MTNSKFLLSRIVNRRQLCIRLLKHDKPIDERVNMFGNIAVTPIRLQCDFLLKPWGRSYKDCVPHLVVFLPSQKYISKIEQA